MTSVLRNFWPGSSSSSKNDDRDDEYSVEYSFAMEYSGPPVSHEIPQVVPVDVRRIPTAAVAAKAAMMSNLSIPVLQPIARKGDKSSVEDAADSRIGKSGRSGRIYSRKLESFSGREGELGEKASSAHNVFDKSSSSSGTLGFSDGRDDSNHLSASSDGEEMDDENKANVAAFDDSSDATTCNSIEEVEEEEEGEAEASVHGHRAPVVRFRDLSNNDSATEESDDDVASMSPSRPLVEDVKGQCHRCNKRHRFAEREVCIVCNAKYCSKCVFRAMGSMPEGRKCIPCIGHRIYEDKRGSLGKCSRMLKSMLTREAVKQIMTAELSSPVNQLPPHLICVNDKALSMEELVMLQSCPNPPKKLKPGKYWYDKVSGFWGKEGEPPSQIISPLLQSVGYQIRQDASNGDTNVLINIREITKAELWILWAAGIHCEGNPHFWITADGSCQHEGMNNVIGKLWEKKRVKLLCMALSLPFPSKSGGEDSVGARDIAAAKRLEQSMLNKLLLIGCDHSGTSTIFKQAKILYNVPFSEDEKQSIKVMIQRNLYRYIGILLEGREHFRENDVMELRRRRRTHKPGPSDAESPSMAADNSDHVDETKAYAFSPKLENFSSWLLQIMMTGNLEVIFPAATREYSPLVEELWKDKAFQAIYKRRNELPMLPRVANYFLDRAAEISRMDYMPSELDILYSDGITSSNGVASMEFSLPNSSQDGYMESLDQNEPPINYELIRVHTSSLGENCKWLEMFEDSDLVMFCISLTEYAEYNEDIDGTRSNKLMETKRLFERIVTHPTLADKHFLLVLNKFDLLEEMIEQTPLSQCEWFQDFNPVISQHPHNPNSNNNPSLAQRASHYIGVKFKRLFYSLTEQKLYVTRATGLEGDSVDKALRYGKEILKWEDDRHPLSMNEDSSESNDPATEGKPAAGPVYRSIYAKDGLMEIPPHLNSPWDFFSESVNKYPNNQMLGRRRVKDGKAGAYSWETYQQVYDATLKIGSAIRRCGVNPGDKCGIYGTNCPEWIMAMEACNSQAITYVPLYDSLGANAVEFIVNHAEVSIAFVHESKLPAILTCLSKCASNLKTIVSFGNVSDKQKEAAEELGVACFSWEEFALTGDSAVDLPSKKKTDVLTIMYTSGTTGEPKGVILTNGAFMSEVLSMDQLLRETDKAGTEEDSYFSFLPLAHIFDQIIETYCIYSGSSIGFWQGDIRFLIEDLLVLKPTIFCGVPRVFDRIYTGIMDRISAGGTLKKSLFQIAYNYKLRNLEKGLKQEEASPLLDRLVFDKIRLGFGGRVRLMLSGAAPLPKHIEEFLRVTCCCVLSQGYGLTESCGGCFTSIANVFPMMGSVGVPMTTIEARLESVPEMGYDALSSSLPRGEICLRGNTLFSGYHKREDLTNEVVVDGWFHTGDVGEWQPNGAMKIIDRKKNIFKLSQGEYVAVESLESTYSRCPLITSIWVYGNSFVSFLVAVVVPERKVLEDWGVNNQEQGDFEFLCNNTKARKYIMEELNKTAKQHNLRSFEMLRAVRLEPVPFDIDRDLITPTFKLKRPQLLKHYKDCIDQLYSEGKGAKP